MLNQPSFDFKWLNTRCKASGAPMVPSPDIGLSPRSKSASVSRPSRIFSGTGAPITPSFSVANKGADRAQFSWRNSHHRLQTKPPRPYNLGEQAILPWQIPYLVISVSLLSLER